MHRLVDLTLGARVGDLTLGAWVGRFDSWCMGL